MIKSIIIKTVQGNVTCRSHAGITTENHRLTAVTTVKDRQQATASRNSPEKEKKNDRNGY